MAELTDLARDLDECPLPAQVRDFIETLTFADADQIEAVIGEFAVNVGPLPVWARNLAYRLICLMRPNDSALLREAGTDLYLHGPDWDDIAIRLQQRADELDSGSDPS